MIIIKNILFWISAIFLLCGYSYYVYITAWIGDDILITMSSVLNFVNGYGLVHNVGERIQVFTHPLWFFLLSFVYYITRNLYLTPFYLSFAFSFIAYVAFIVFNRKNGLSLLIGGTTLLCSREFTDFSTSGLEAPLSHLLLILIVTFGEKTIKLFNDSKNDKTIKNSSINKILTLFFFFSSLLFITRQDLTLIIAPYFLYITYRAYKNNIAIKTIFKLFLLGTLPASMWEIFSMIYYGFPFPNTYYAKLYAQTPLKNDLIKGLKYYKAAFQFDPFSILMILIFLILGTTKKVISKHLILGLFLYLCYILYIGGDFMAGRLLTPCILVGALNFRNLRFCYCKSCIFLIVLVITTGTLNMYYRKPGFFFNESNKEDADATEWRFCESLADERGYYFGSQSLSNYYHKWKLNPKEYDWKFTKYNSEIAYADAFLGIIKLQKGPNVYVLDKLALNQALLARLPSDAPNPRPGHVFRKIPTGYTESIQKQKNLIQNKELHDYYNHILRVTRGNIFSYERFKSIFYLNFIKNKLNKNIYNKQDY